MAPGSTLADGGSYSARISYEPPDLIRKQGDHFRICREVEAMNYVRNHTSIPVPVVLDVHIGTECDKGLSWILMKQLPGCQLGEAWPNMTPCAQAQTIHQLKSYFDKLHNLYPPQPQWIGSCTRGLAYDHRLDYRATCGPFTSVSEFHDYLVSPVRDCPRPEWAAKYRSLLTDEYRIVFAHADISWENILVDPETGDVTGILDWEMAGYWPEWWEYRKSLFGSRSRLWWINILKEIMRVYESETETDMELEMF